LGVEVDGHGEPDVLVAALGKSRSPGCAGVVDEQIQPSVALGDVVADQRGRILVGQVDGDEAHAVLAEGAGQCAQALLAAGDEHERCVRLTGESARGRFPDPAGGAGD